MRLCESFPRSRFGQPMQDWVNPPVRRAATPACPRSHLSKRPLRAISPLAQYEEVMKASGSISRRKFCRIAGPRDLAAGVAGPNSPSAADWITAKLWRPM